MRNREHVYTPEEERVADYIVERSGNNMGGGDDPIGFLIASHNYLGDQLKELTSAKPALALIKQDAELLLDNAATASQERELLRNEEGDETVLREAVRLNVYEPLMKIILALSIKNQTVANGAWRALADEKPWAQGRFLVWAEGRSIQLLYWEVEDDQEGFHTGYNWQEWPTHWAPFDGPNGPSVTKNEDTLR